MAALVVALAAVFVLVIAALVVTALVLVVAAFVTVFAAAAANLFPFRAGGVLVLWLGVWGCLRHW
jgi:hypothetical protein